MIAAAYWHSECWNGSKPWILWIWQDRWLSKCQHSFTVQHWNPCSGSAAAYRVFGNRPFQQNPWCYLLKQEKPPLWVKWKSSGWCHANTMLKLKQSVRTTKTCEKKALDCNKTFFWRVFFCRSVILLQGPVAQWLQSVRVPRQQFLQPCGYFPVINTVLLGVFSFFLL